jgi:hypothetical protein
MATNNADCPESIQSQASYSVTPLSEVDSSKVEITDSQTIMVSTDNTDRFFQRIRTDLMYELRNIQHGERPVTGTNHREQIQQFMKKHMVDSSTEKTNIPANVDSVEIHRPEAVIVEVQAVVELRPVSSVLQSVAFRRQLENVIRGYLPNRPPASSISTNRSNRTLQTAAETSSSSGNRSSPILPAVQPSFERPQLTRQDSAESIDSFSSARSSHEQDIDSDVEEAEESATPLAIEPDLASRFEIPAAPLIPERVSNEHNQPPQASNLWNEITTLQREEIVEEISELLHTRLVSSTLEGEFRSVLEMLAQNQVSSSGINGRAVQEFIHTLPRSGVQRNDFSQLGIPVAPENENWDNISVRSVSAHSVPYTQTNTYLGREIQSMKSQMNEMKSMLKLNLDLQMDIQRAIRQEVAAAMNNFVGQNGIGASASASRPSGPVSDTHCLICLERHTDTVLYQCGHMCVCFVCGRDLMSRGHNCPVCRAPIKDVIRAYKTNAE